MKFGALLLPSEIRLVEVGLRDGIQVISQPITTRQKLAAVEAMIDAGVRHIEAVSFAHPKVLPQLADAENLMALVPRDRGVVYRGLVPNIRGAERAATCELDEMVALACADEGVSLINQGRGVEEVLGELSAIGEIARLGGSRLVVGVAMAFFAPGRGVVPARDRARCVDAAVEAGADGVYLACSTGMEDPGQVAEGVSAVRSQYPDLEVGVHLHARNGMALASAVAAMSAGAAWLEGSFGGMGGDLWAPGSMESLGNVPFEDLVNLCDALGVRTGVDITAYLPVVEEMSALTGWIPQSAVIAGGTRESLAAHHWNDRSTVTVTRDTASMSEQRLPRIARAWFDAHNSIDTEGLADILATDVRVDSLFREDPVVGRVAALSHFESTVSAFPDLQMRLVNPAISPERRRVLVEVLFTGHFTGSLGESGLLPGTGRAFEVLGVVMLTLGENAVHHVRTLFDRDEWLGQIGLDPKNRRLHVDG